MNRYLVFVSGFVAGAIVGVGLFLGWALLHLPPRYATTPKEFANAPVDRLPFDGEWLVFWGGDKKSDNHHHGVPPQDLAIDFVKYQPGAMKTFVSGGRANSDYAAWSQPVYSPVEGTIDIAVDGIPDNKPGEMNSHMVSGNCIHIRTTNGMYVVLCHFRNGSIQKKKGDTVKAGDRLGECGNSGNSSEPHIHFHIQSEPGFVRGMALRPVFKSVDVARSIRSNYSPIKGDIVSNPESSGR